MKKQKPERQPESIAEDASAASADEKVTGAARIKQLQSELATAKRSQISAAVAAIIDPLKVSMKINSAEAQAFQRRLSAARMAGDAEAESDIMTILATRNIRSGASVPPGGAPALGSSLLLQITDDELSLARREVEAE